MKISALLSSMALTLPAVLATAVPVPAAAIEVSVTTSQLVYIVGRDVDISISLCNDSSEPVTIHYFPLPCSPPHFEILTSGDEVLAFATCDGTDGAGRAASWDPGECKTSQVSWPQSSGRFAHLDDPPGPQVPAGVYRVRMRSPFSTPVVSPDFAIVTSVPMSPSAAGVLLLVLAISGVWLLRSHRAG